MKIAFYRIASNQKNETYHAKIMSFSFDSGITREEAVRFAIEEFQRNANVDHWTKAADFYE